MAKTVALNFLFNFLIHPPRELLHSIRFGLNYAQRKCLSFSWESVGWALFRLICISQRNANKNFRKINSIKDVNIASLYFTPDTYHLHYNISSNRTDPRVRPELNWINSDFLPTFQQKWSFIYWRLSLTRYLFTNSRIARVI